MLIVETCRDSGTNDVLVAFGNGQCSGFPYVRADVGRALFYGKHYYAADHGDFGSTEDAQGHCTDERIAVRQVLLECIDRQESKIGFLLCISQKVDINQFPDLKVLRRDVLYHLGKVLGNIATFGNELEGPSVQHSMADLVRSTPIPL